MSNLADDWKNGKTYFYGGKYEVRVVNEGKHNEKLMIIKLADPDTTGIATWDRAWKRPLVIGG